ncbi:MAG: hypothetical protein R6T93_12180 [Trueperaceae bacterium]
MSFGDLLVLLLFVVFVILPSITRSQQQRRGGAPGTPGRPPARPRTGAPSGAPEGAPAAGGAPPSARRSAEPTARGGDTATFPPIDDDDLARRLAEARARVQRAMQQRGAPATPVAPADDPRARAGAPLVSGAPKTIGGTPVGAGVDPRTRARGQLVSGGARTLSGAPVGSGHDPRGRARAPLFGGERGATLAERAQRAAEAAGGVPPRDLRANAPQLEVERLTGGGERPAGRHGTLRFDADAVLSGIVWHQVLGAPRARRRVGGGPFPER